MSSFLQIKNKITENRYLIFLLIVVLHFLFKLSFLDYYGFWYDEVFGLYYSEQDWGLIKHTSEWDMNPPLYYYFLWIWRNLFGISEFSIRFSSVLFSSLSAGMIYVFSAKYFNRITAMISLLLFTSSTEIYFYSHEARCYSLVLFLSLCSSYFFFALMRRKSVLSFIMLGLLNFLLIYTHYLTGLLLLFQISLAILVCKKVHLKQLALAFGITVVLASWRFTKKTIFLIFHHEKSFWLGPPTWEDLQNTFFDFFNGKIYFFIYLLLSISLVIYFLRSKKHFLKNHRIELSYLLLCGVFTILVSFTVSLFMPVFLKRYFLYAVPFLYILIAFLVSEAQLIYRNILFVIICVISAFSLTAIDLRAPKPMNYRDAVAFVKKIKTPETVILVETQDLGSLFAYYYDINIFKDYYNFDSKLKQNNVYPVSDTSDLMDLDLKKYQRVILTQSFEDLNPGNPGLLKTLSEKFHFKSEISYYTGIKILVYYN